MNINDIFCKRVKQLRLKQGLSQESLANIAGIDRTYISSIEKGKRNVSLNVAMKIATALKSNLEDLVK